VNGQTRQLLQALQVENLSFTYENRQEPALEHINLSVEENEFILIAGPSGSGKSTLIKCVNGLIPHRYLGNYSGSVKVKGVTVQNATFLDLSLLLGTVLQEVDKQIVSSFVEDEVAFGPSNLALPRPEIEGRIEMALGEMGIYELRKRFTTSLSGGQKQRVAISDILAMEPQIVLFDEPLANLDSHGVRLMQEVFRELHSKGKTVLVSEHRTEEVLRAEPSRVVIINQGKIVSDSSDGRSLADYGDIIKVPAEYVLMKRFGTLPENFKSPIPTSPLFPQEDSHELIRCQDLVIEYPGGIRALDRVSFSIRQGEKVALLGNNGAGKSTLALSICGLIKPSSGRILIEGKDSTLLGPSEISGTVTIVFQSPFSMLFSKTVRDELSFGPRNVGMDQKEIETKIIPVVAQQCGVSNLLDGSPYASSFGEKKRICVASVLTMQPKCVILDEPTAGQDYRSYTRFMDFIHSLGVGGRLRSFIVITHDPDLAIEYTDRSIVLGDGKVIADGPTRSMLANKEILERGGIRETSLIDISRKLTRGIEVLPLKALIASSPD
jgi:energy-coupling factor transporter ATP-binding protein EcfA2